MIRTIVIDDEPLALQLVNDYVSKTPFLEFAGSFNNPLKAMEFLIENEVDLIFLDIQMPEFNGIDFMRVIEKGPKVIFTTAYEKYALQGIKLEAVDYLLKPFNYDEFLIASHKAEKIIRLEKAERENKIEANNDFLFIKSEYKIRRISFNDILYIEGLKNYIKVFLLHESKPVLSLNTFKSIESKLPESRFMRVHRSFIVNLEKIEVIERNRIVFGKIYIPVSEQYKEQFQEYLNKNFL